MMVDTTAGLVARARQGDPRALEELVRSLQHDVFGLAVRMLWQPDDAEDASQEILMKVVTHLATFRGDCAFKTWVYRIATNHLLNVKRSRLEREELTFSALGEQLAQAVAHDRSAATPSNAADSALLEQEVKIGCTSAMLLALDREHRVAYIVGDVFELRSDDAAYVLDIEPAAFRKRLSRARARLRAFMRQHCGLVGEGAPCRCADRVNGAVARGRVDPQRLLFATHPERLNRRLPVLEAVGEMETLHEIAGVFQSHPRYRAPDRLLRSIAALIGSGRFRLID